MRSVLKASLRPTLPAPLRPLSPLCGGFHKCQRVSDFHTHNQVVLRSLAQSLFPPPLGCPSSTPTTTTTYYTVCILQYYVQYIQFLQPFLFFSSSTLLRLNPLEKKDYLSLFLFLTPRFLLYILREKSRGRRTSPSFLLFLFSIEFGFCLSLFGRSGRKRKKGKGFLPSRKVLQIEQRKVDRVEPEEREGERRCRKIYCTYVSCSTSPIILFLFH